MRADSPERRRAPALRDDGFSLVELLVVMVVIGVLAAIAIPAFLSQRQSAHDTGAKTDLRGLALAMETYRDDHSRYARSNAEIDGAGLAPRTSPGTHVAILFADTQGFCLASTNRQGRTASGPLNVLGTVVHFYDSRAGGLKTQAEGCPSFPSPTGVLAVWPPL